MVARVIDQNIHRPLFLQDRLDQCRYGVSIRHISLVIAHLISKFTAALVKFFPAASAYYHHTGASLHHAAGHSQTQSGGSAGNHCSFAL